MKQLDLSHMQFNTAITGAPKAATGSSVLPHKINKDGVHLLHDHSSTSLWVTEKLLTPAINNGKALKNINDRTAPGRIAVSGNNITYLLLAERKR